MNFNTLIKNIILWGFITLILSFNIGCESDQINDPNHFSNPLPAPTILSATYIDSIGYVELEIRHVPDSTATLSIQYSYNNGSNWLWGAYKWLGTVFSDTSAITKGYSNCRYSMENLLESA